MQSSRTSTLQCQTTDYSTSSTAMSCKLCTNCKALHLSSLLAESPILSRTSSSRSIHRFLRRQSTAAPVLPETRAFSRRLIAYLTVFLPVTPFFRANDMRITCVYDDHYPRILITLQKTGNKKIKIWLNTKSKDGSVADMLSALPSSPQPPHSVLTQLLV